MQNNEMPRAEFLGTITFIKNDYGFITTQAIAGDTPRQYFFHASNFQKGVRPTLGARVSFLLGQPLRPGQKLQAIRVRPADSLVNIGMSLLGGPQ
jgi:cold shock CspA family protein